MQIKAITIMKYRIIFLLLLSICFAVNAQDFSQYKALPDSAYACDADYRQGNKYQRDAILFVDMLADTHPYYITKERREQLMAKREGLLQECADCQSDTAFVSLLNGVLGKLYDKHTNVIDTLTLAENKKVAAQRAAEAVKEDSSHLMSRHDALFDYTMLPEQSICYMQFNQCFDARTMRDESLPRFDHFLEDMFHAIDSLQVQTLVVDAQYNNGGSSRHCDELLSYLYPLNQLKDFTTYIRFSNLMASYNPRIAVAKQTWEEQGHIDELYAKPTGQMPELDRKIYKGQVVFIQGPKTFSSAGILMTLARDNNIGVIIGDNSTYSPSHYGEVLPYVLPNTGILGTISCKFFARPDSTCVDDEVLKPDMKADLKDKDALLQFVTTTFGKK